MKTPVKAKIFSPEEKKIKEEEYSNTTGLAPEEQEDQMPAISEEEETVTAGKSNESEGNEDN